MTDIATLDAGPLLVLALIVTLSFALGWAVAVRRSLGAEERALMIADRTWLASALADSERLCAVQAGQIDEMAAELASLRVPKISSIRRHAFDAVHPKADISHPMKRRPGPVLVPDLSPGARV